MRKRRLISKRYNAVPWRLSRLAARCGVGWRDGRHFRLRKRWLYYSNIPRKLRNKFHSNTLQMGLHVAIPEVNDFKTTLSQKAILKACYFQKLSFQFQCLLPKLPIILNFGRNWIAEIKKSSAMEIGLLTTISLWMTWWTSCRAPSPRWFWINHVTESQTRFSSIFTPGNCLARQKTLITKAVSLQRGKTERTKLVTINQ